MGPEDQENAGDDGHGECRHEIERLKEMVLRAGAIFAHPGCGVPKLGEWNWPELAKEYLKEKSA